MSALAARQVLSLWLFSHRCSHGQQQQMSDLFNSINDPLFFPHHAGLDRVWALWQEQDPKRIMDAGEATGLSDTSPMTLDSWFWVGFAGKDRQTVEVMDALNRDGRGVVCYKYEGNTFDSYFK
ncbi:hypothetical protein EG327_005883 [Venturia inaequalis]|uniref:Tyrosinase copper-binding domain-containing protein n=1 Tax=Venturia inaequalis TaxID=5025 RepID=A0A8H3V5D4_VENIN|nr:hypothetical protein EG327_005883 [Venturia inaequalis]